MCEFLKWAVPLREYTGDKFPHRGSSILFQKCQDFSLLVMDLDFNIKGCRWFLLSIKSTNSLSVSKSSNSYAHAKAQPTGHDIFTNNNETVFE